MTEERIIARAASAEKMTAWRNAQGNLADAVAQAAPREGPSWWDRNQVTVCALLGVAAGVALAVWRH